MARVTKIPATKELFTALPIASLQKRRVAGYARVSTDSDEQFTSYEAQVDYYTNYIKGNPDWEFVEVYTDEGISALNTKRRDGFNRMVEDALAGKIDLIVTKSVSRFARNTVDSLTTIRKLKDAGCECYFEKENIYTFDGKGELLLTIMSSLAQEESRSISENVTWGQRKAFSDGKVRLPYKQFLGYKKGADNRPEIVEEEAEIIRLIYKLFLEGETPVRICKKLESLGIRSPGGKPRWNESTVSSILRNEKYKGDALLQKRFTVYFLEKKMKENEGEIPQYYVEQSHEPIIDPDDWDLVQIEYARRLSMNRRYSMKGQFAGKLICAECGNFYGQKVWHSNDAYRKIVWRCNGKVKGETKCTTPTLVPETIQKKFMEAYNIFLPDKDIVIDGCNFIRKELADCKQINTEIERLEEEIAVVAEMTKACIQQNATTAQSQEEYMKRYNSLVSRYENAVSEVNRLNVEKEKRQNRDRELRLFIKALEAQPAVMTEWNNKPWIMLLEHGTIHHNGSITFRFKNGTEK